MINNARSDHVHIKICHHIGAYYHSTVLFVKCIDHDLQSTVVGIYVVTVKLDSKFTAKRMVNSQIPATAYTQIITFGNQVDQAFIVFKFINGFGGTVGRVIVDNDQVEFEICFLAEYRTDGIAYGTNTVAYRNNHRSFVWEVAGVEFYFLEFRLQITAYLLQMFGTCLFHLNLSVTIFRIYIVEYFFTTFSGIVFYFRIKVFIDMY